MIAQHTENLFFKTSFQNFQRQFRMLFCEPSNLLNFSSFDAMNLTLNEYVRRTGVSFMSKWGMGNVPSRPIPQLDSLKQEIERSFASMTLFETATLLEMQKIVPSLMIQHLISPKTLILKQDSFPYSPGKPSLIKTFDINDEPALTRLIEKIDRDKHDLIIILVESISSITGKIANLKQLATLSTALGALLVVDDTNCITAMGRHGLGLAATTQGVDIVFGSFSKTFGSYASYILSSKEVKDYILTTSPIAMSASNLSPLTLGFLKASFELLPSMTDKRCQLKHLSKQFRDLFIKSGIAPADSNSHILSLTFDSPLELKHFSFHLSEHQCIANVLRSQDGHAKKQTSRFIINIDHTSKDLNRLSSILKTLRSTPYCEAL